MAELETFTRATGGKHSNRRLREGGRVPAVLYGHGQANVSLAVGSESLQTALRHGSRLVSLTGAVSESAFIRDLQWDTYGMHVLHVDFTRISADELVKVTVTIELRGEAPGVKDGGVVVQFIHEAHIECPAGSIPETIYVNVNHLKLNESILLGNLELPEKTKIFGDADSVVVQCNIPVELPDEEETAAAGEPEVIGAKKEEESEEE